MAPDERTPNQIVALRLWEARTARGWSQKQAAEALAERGFDWSKATYSTAEASRDPSKPSRRFSADELLAFALVFKQPVAWFLTPPEAHVIVLNEEPLFLRDILQMGLYRDLGDLRPLADRLREVATAIEVFEEDRQPKSDAELIVDQATAPRLGDEYGGETGKRRLEREVEESRPRLQDTEEEKGSA